jgi:hypothetical protein
MKDKIMYCGYDINFFQDSFFEDVDNYYDYGLSMFEQQKTDVMSDLEHFALTDGALDGAAIQSNWFPQIRSDIFLSHSHSDEKMAIAFAGALKKDLNLDVFIDSCLWGYSNDLLRMIDNEYCLNFHSDTYSYSKRNSSTSHVHMMLSTALTMMIDNSECVFFLNTPNSLNTEDVIRQTMSPWIYSELTISRLIQKKKPARHIKMRIQDSLQKSTENFSIDIKYTVDTSHFRELTIEEFQSWRKALKNSPESHPLDVLYRVANPIIQERNYL